MALCVNLGPNVQIYSPYSQTSFVRDLAECAKFDSAKSQTKQNLIPLSLRLS
jgi:hypothetical protein